MRRAPVRSLTALGLALALAITGVAPASAAVDEWTPPVTLSGGSGSSSDPQLVSDGTRITAIWRESDGGNPRIATASSTNDGATWSAPLYLSDGDEIAGTPRVATDGTTINAAWVQTGAGFFRVMVSVSLNGGVTWSSPVDIAGGAQSGGDLNLVRDGSVVTAMWSYFDGSDTRIVTKTSTDGGALWGSGTALSPAGVPADDPQLVTDGDTLTAVWEQLDAATVRVFSSSSTNDGSTWSSPVAVSQTGQDASAPVVVTNGTTITAVWRRSDGSDTRVQAASSTNGTTWSAPVSLSESGESALDHEAVAEGGTVTVGWRRYDGADYRTQVASSSDGLTWGTPVTLSPVERNVGRLNLASDGATITAAWTQNEAGSLHLKVASSTNGGVTWSTPITVAEGVIASAFDLVTERRTMTVAWEQTIGGTDRILASSFTATPDVARLAGDNRYETAVEISQVFGTDVPVVYLATGLNYPDALSAASAAAYQGGPLLLTPPTSLPTVVRNELIRLNPDLVVIAGGTGVVSSSVQNAVAAALPGATVRRDAGADRYATSRIIAQRAFPAGTTATAFIATGANFPDALSASAAAGAADAPVILVDGRASSLDTPTRNLLGSLGVDEAFIAGGTAVVSTGVQNSLRSLLGSSNVTRLSGSDRYATSVAINDDQFTSAPTVFLATGLGYADALAGAALAGTVGRPLFVVPRTCVPPAVLAQIDDLRPGLVLLLGGTAVLTGNVANLGSC